MMLSPDGTELAESQRRFAAALLDASAPIPTDVRALDAREAARRFAVYRNNVIVSLVSALAARFPVVCRLVGEEFFQAMAREYVLAAPPRSPVLLLYGDTFPAFIENFAPAASLDYLADVARLEFARGRAYHAADAVPIDRSALARLDPGEIAALRISLHPSVSVVSSGFPIVSIWEAHQQPELVPVEPWQAEAALVARPGLEVEVWRLSPGGDAFLDCLAQGGVMADAADRAAAASAEFNITDILALLLRANCITGLRRGPATPS
jgi:Putative DNA-binding domain